MQIVVQAVNGDSQGVVSEPIQFTMPVLSRTAASGATRHADTIAPVEEIVIATNGNGSSNENGKGSNGHANGRRMPALA